jgi:phosphoribosylformylglycinamidine synthase
VARDTKVLARLEERGQLVLRYEVLIEQAAIAATQRVAGDPLGRGYQPLIPYPDNPNGSMGDVAGVCDATGRVFGLMPHPERFVDPTQHPRWTRERDRTTRDGLRVFQNAVRYFL